MRRGKVWAMYMKWRVKRMAQARKSQAKRLPLLLMIALALVLGFGIAAGKDVLFDGIKSVSKWTWPTIIAHWDLALATIGLLIWFGACGLVALILFNTCVKVLSAEMERIFIRRKK